MATSTKIAAVSAGILLVLGLTACAGEPDEQPALPSTPVVQLGAPGEPNKTLSPEEAAALDSPAYVEEDVLFIRDMLHHHSQAIVMTGYVNDRTEDEEVRGLAERMTIGQTDEMKLMESWLQDNGEPARDPDHAHDAHVGMPGLLTDAELAELEAASGDEFDQLFLEFMIRHHQGAVQMVLDLYEDGGGNQVEIDTIARHVEADQNIEIKRMDKMLLDRS